MHLCLKFYIPLFILVSDWTIQVAALIVMGCVVDLPIPEIISLFHNENQSPESAALRNASISEVINKPKCFTDDYDSDQCSDEEECDEAEETVSERLADIKCLETETIIIPPEKLEKLSWLIEICLKNLGWIIKNGIMEVNKITVGICKLMCT